MRVTRDQARGQTRRGVIGRGAAALALGGLALPALGGRARAEAGAIRITRQPSIIYLPTYVIERQRLVQKHAAALGLGPVEAGFTTFSGGGNATDAMLAGSIDVVNTGPGNMMLLWDRTRGGVQGIAASSALPLILVSRNPAIKGLADFGPKDRIAVPTVRVSTQALLLQMACAKQFGAADANKLDANTVQLGHPDAFAALLNPTHEVGSHFSAPPFIYEELDRVPGCHQVIADRDIIGGPLTNAIFFTTTKFAAANPKLVQALRLATEEALAFFRADPGAAVDIYREMSGDRMEKAAVMAMLDRPGMRDFNPQPQGTFAIATHMHTAGLLKTQPKGWQDYMLPELRDFGGAS